MKENEDDNLLQQLKTTLLRYYKPARDPIEADLHLTTDEIWRQLLTIYPNELILTKTIVAEWLMEGDFRLFDFGKMRFEWLLKYTGHLAK